MWTQFSTQVSKVFTASALSTHAPPIFLTAWLCPTVLLQRTYTVLCAGMAALHEAVLTGNLEVVKLLVKYGADVHQRDEDGWTPLHMACSDGYPEIAR